MAALTKLLEGTLFRGDINLHRFTMSDPGALDPDLRLSLMCLIIRFYQRTH